MTAVRLLYLRAAAKVMAALLVGGFTYVLLASVLPEHSPKSSGHFTAMPLPHLAPGEWRRLSWRGRPLLVLRRTPAMLESLEHERALADPDSKHSRQPDSARNRSRSPDAEWLVVFGHGTDFGCPVEFVDTGAEGAPVRPWPGGFRDRCRGSWYDLAGRVYRGQPAQRNLPVPDFRIQEGRLVLAESL